MFPNLEAEQARNSHKNEFIAAKLGITRQTLEKRKRVGGFKLEEINVLMSMYGNDFDYLFSLEKKILPNIKLA